MIEYIIYYVAIGFVLNTFLALMVFYKNEKEGYVAIPHMPIYFLTIFSWPITLWHLIGDFNQKDDKDAE